MQLVLAIAIDEGVTRKDIALALERAARSLRKAGGEELEEGDSGMVTDPDTGDKVGHWEVIDEQA